MLYVRENQYKEVLMADTKQVAAEALEAFNAHDADGMRATYADEIVFEAPATFVQRVSMKRSVMPWHG